MYNKKMGKLYVNEKGDMKSGGKASGKGVSAALVWLPVGALVLLALLPLPALAATPITNCTELQNIRDDLAGDYYLANDTNCSGFDYAGDGKGFMPIGTPSSKFTGTFDGKGYKITHLYINRQSINRVGLFGCAGSGSEIKNVGLEEVNVRGSSYVGGLVGDNVEGTITNSYSSGTVHDSSDTVGGLVGHNSGTITNSYSSGSVSSFFTAVGGLVGKNDGTIENSYSSGSVSGDWDSWAVGGLVGYNYGTIENSYSSGSVIGDITGDTGEDVGGLVGYNHDGTITNSYSTGSVSGDTDVGGLVGTNWYGTITNSYWDIYRSGRINCVGYGSSSGCTGKNSGNSEPDYWYNSTHAPMDNWDFNTVWGRVDGVTYPYLQWEFADVNCTCGDVCVNETGWQRDRSPFIASNTPIQPAIDNTSEGNTICVEDGMYTENVDVTKRLTVCSENGSASTTVQAQSTSDHVFYVTADYVNVSGFTMTGAKGSGKAGICLSSGMDNCTIYNNSALNNYVGIYLNNADNNNISCNWVHNNNEKGFYLTSGSTGNTIGNNNIMSNGASANDSWHYNFYNDQENDVTVTDNYWGTNNETLIAESIYDWNEDSSKGNVTFDQRSGPAPCAPIPELATVVLFSAGLLMLAGYAGYRRKKEN